jgi:hypothetical protein
VDSADGPGPPTRGESPKHGRTEGAPWQLLGVGVAHLGHEVRLEPSHPSDRHTLGEGRRGADEPVGRQRIRQASPDTEVDEAAKLCQLLQQRARLPEIGRVKALGELAVKRRQQLAGVGVLALVLPQAAQAHGGPQLQPFRLLPAGTVDGLMQAGLRHGLMLQRARQQ